ncbi:four-helix bundle copper-binding protein [Tepidibacter aestuarii]|uniref:four-helix bundle copper-binding protein n=1 Tax=Tepidibacter aestuarii TaxID=2925782 RepID=UPI0020BF79E0|nr:four-helix bundle copper-binding protein [Tepidibacter aestuarii]CAH2214938.1 putative Uncharacterized cysteine-rich protein YhjQ [Tepidibacter aestuarii]
MRSDYPDSYYENIDYNRPYHGDLLETLQECEATCEHMTTFIKKKYPKRKLQLILLRDCADICGLTAKYIARQSPFARDAARLCANICYRCGMECAKYPDRESQRCSKICLNCARECQAFAMGY